MKYLSLLLIIVSTLFFFRFTPKDSTEGEMTGALKSNQMYRMNVDSLLVELVTFEKQVKEGASRKELKKSFVKARNYFKRVEFIMCCLQSEEARLINGPPIAINDINNGQPTGERAPHGFQVIEEQLYQDSAIPYADLEAEIRYLKAIISQLILQERKTTITNYKAYNQLIWDAIRQEIIRIETLGITGFDTQLSKTAISETSEILASIQTVLSYFEPLFMERKQWDNYSRGWKLTQDAFNYCQSQPSFEKFDRLHFLTNYLHPLAIWQHQAIRVLDLALALESTPIHPNATFLYDPIFFNRSYFGATATESQIKLGQKLFSDPILSLNNSRSCSTCHDPQQSWSDGKIKNTMLNTGENLQRNTPSLFNAVFQTRFFFDNRAKRMQIQIQDVIQNPHEMGGDFAEIILQLKENPAYRELFQQAFQGTISKTTIIEALTAFTKTIVANNSRLDQYMRGNQTALNRDEQTGFNLFTGKAKCATCHFAPLFNGLLPPFYTETESEILGVPQHKKNPQLIDDDLGKYAITGIDLHKFSFKTPNLRNIANTAPYMHNGVFQTLEEVIEFYNDGGGNGQGMQLKNQTLPAEKLHLTKREKRQLILFLKALTEVDQ